MTRALTRTKARHSRPSHHATIRLLHSSSIDFQDLPIFAIFAQKLSSLWTPLSGNISRAILPVISNHPVIQLSLSQLRRPNPNSLHSTTSTSYDPCIRFLCPNTLCAIQALHTASSNRYLGNNICYLSAPPVLLLHLHRILAGGFQKKTHEGSVVTYMLPAGPTDDARAGRMIRRAQACGVYGWM